MRNADNPERLPAFVMEGPLIAAGQNLKRRLAATGCGRRHGPSGSLAAVAPANQLGLRVV